MKMHQLKSATITSLILLIIFCCELVFVYHQMLNEISENIGDIPSLYADSSHYVSYSVEMANSLKSFDFKRYLAQCKDFHKSPLYVCYLSLYFTVCSPSMISAHTSSLLLLPILIVAFCGLLYAATSNKVVTILGGFAIIGCKVILNNAMLPMPLILSTIAGLLSLICSHFYFKYKNHLTAIILGMSLAFLWLARLHNFLIVISGIALLAILNSFRAKMYLRHAVLIILPLIITLIFQGIKATLYNKFFYVSHYLDEGPDRWTSDNLLYYPKAVYTEFFSMNSLFFTLFLIFIYGLLHFKKSEELTFRISIIISFLFGLAMLTYHSVNVHYVFTICYLIMVFIALTGINHISQLRNNSGRLLTGVISVLFIIQPIVTVGKKIKILSFKKYDKALLECYSFCVSTEGPNYFMGSAGGIYFQNINLIKILDNINKKSNIDFSPLVQPYNYNTLANLKKSVRLNAGYLIRIKTLHDQTHNNLEPYSFMKNKLEKIKTSVYPELNTEVIFYKII